MSYSQTGQLEKWLEDEINKTNELEEQCSQLKGQKIILLQMLNDLSSLIYKIESIKTTLELNKEKRLELNRLIDETILKKTRNVKIQAE